MHHRDPIRQHQRFEDVVRDKEDGLAKLALDPQQFLLQRTARDRVECAERLIHEQVVLAGGQRSGHPDTLLLTARQIARVARRVSRWTKFDQG